MFGFVQNVYFGHVDDIRLSDWCIRKYCGLIGCSTYRLRILLVPALFSLLSAQQILNERKPEQG